jgi:crotonobetainyl-CoA:carnitine CoA-transferase CaiB-like acyl-CoA transferase
MRIEDFTAFLLSSEFAVPSWCRPHRAAFTPRAIQCIAALERIPRRSAAWRRPAPALGEHTDAVLAEAGLDAAAIMRLRQEGAAA